LNRTAVLIGFLLLAAGIAMYFLLEQLALETFRADRSVWLLTSYALIGLGVLAVFLGLGTRGGNAARTSVDQAVGYFSRLALLNTVVAAIFVFPLLIPSLEFPILITRWPGIYMVIAYTSFVMIGVLGNVAWSSLLANRKGSLVRWQLWTQLALTGVGIYTFSIFTFLGGYVGATLDYGGAGPGLVGIDMEFAVVPAGLSIFGIVVGELLGVVNFLASGRFRGAQNSSATGP
jgi:hypothetical protein